MNKGGGAQQQGGGGGGGESADFLWIVAGIIIAIMITWHYGKIHITKGILIIRFYEIEAIKYAFAYWGDVATWAKEWNINLPLPDLTVLNLWQNFIDLTTGAVPFNTIITLSGDIGSYLLYPIIFILALLTIYLYHSSIAQHFKNIFTMSHLRQLEQENWPQISPIINVDLANMPIDEGPWAIAMSPMQFCKKHKLLKVDTDPTTGRPIATLLRGPAHNLLSMQLGPKWKGVQFLPKYAQALFAIFIARVNGDKKSADALVVQLAASAAKGKLDFTGVRKLLINNYGSREVGKVIGVHAYVTTVMASLLSASREAGVLASSEFIWLKPLDRRLWYMLNSVGRPTAVAEISGAFAHWLAERKLGLPLTIPMVEEAVTGLEVSLKDIIYKPDEEPDQFMVKQQKKKKRKKYLSFLGIK